MARGAYNATTAATNAVAAGLYWTTAVIYNASDTTVYVQWTTESDELTVANGIPIAASGTLRLVANDSGPRPAIRVMHGGSGNKDIRYVLS